jgi:hypothetical protein
LSLSYACKSFQTSLPPIYLVFLHLLLIGAPNTPLHVHLRLCCTILPPFFVCQVFVLFLCLYELPPFFHLCFDSHCLVPPIMLVVIMILSSCWYPRIVSPLPSLAYQLSIWNYFKRVTTCPFTCLLLGPCFLFSHPLTFYYPSILTPLSPNEWTCIPTWKLWWNLCCIVEIPLANQAKVQFAHCCPSSSLWATFLTHVIDIKAQVAFFFTFPSFDFV